MSLGGDQFVHPPHTGDVVKISSLNEPFYAGQFAGGRRVAQRGTSCERTGHAADEWRGGTLADNLPSPL